MHFGSVSGRPMSARGGAFSKSGRSWRPFSTKNQAKSNKKLMVTSKGNFWKIVLSPSRGCDFWRSRVSKSIKNRWTNQSTIFQNAQPTMTFLLAPRFDDFWWVWGRSFRQKLVKEWHSRWSTFSYIILIILWSVFDQFSTSCCFWCVMEVVIDFSSRSKQKITNTNC